MTRRFPLSLAVLAALTAPVGGQTFTFTKVADTATLVPVTSQAFLGVGGFPSSAGGTTTFQGNAVGVTGIYSWTAGTLSRLADNSVAIPDGSGTFTAFGATAPTDAGTTVFRGTGASSQQGIYAATAAGLARVVDRTTPIPGGTGTFTGFNIELGLSGGTVAFRGAGASGQFGAYTAAAGTVSVVLDGTTPIPGGGGNFTNVNNPQVSGTAVVATASGAGGQSGVYAKVGANPLVRLADLTTPVPGGTGAFASVSDADVSGNSVTFRGTDAAGAAGVYRYDLSAITLSALVNGSTPIPEGAGTFTNFRDYAPTDGGNFAFVGDGATSRGIYAVIDGQLRKVADNSQPFDGKPLATTPFFIGADGFEGSTLTFRVIFADASIGVYRATFTPVPEPTLAGLLTLAGFAAWRRFSGRTGA